MQHVPPLRRRDVLLRVFHLIYANSMMLPSAERRDYGTFTVLLLHQHAVRQHGEDSFPREQFVDAEAAQLGRDFLGQVLQQRGAG